MGSNIPVMNESMNEMICEIISDYGETNHVLNCGYEIKSIKSFMYHFVD